MTYFTDNASVSDTIQAFKEFYTYAGLKLNQSKTIGLIVESGGHLYENI